MTKKGSARKGWEMTQQRRKELNTFCLSYEECPDLGCPLYWFANQGTKQSARYNCDFESEFYSRRDIRKAHELLQVHNEMHGLTNNKKSDDK